MKKYVIDTHTLLWYCADSKKISSTAKTKMRDIVKRKALGYISSIVIAESVASLIKEKEEDTIDNLFSFLDKYSIAVVDISGEQCKKLREYLRVEVVIRGKKKRLEIHDSLIMILAKNLKASVITKDEVITASGLVKTIW